MHKKIEKHTLQWNTTIICDLHKSLEAQIQACHSENTFLKLETTISCL